MKTLIASHISLRVCLVAILALTPVLHSRGYSRAYFGTRMEEDPWNPVMRAGGTDEGMINPNDPGGDLINPDDGIPPISLTAHASASATLLIAANGVNASVTLNGSNTEVLFPSSVEGPIDYA